MTAAYHVAFRGVKGKLHRTRVTAAYHVAFRGVLNPSS